MKNPRIVGIAGRRYAIALPSGVSRGIAGFLLATTSYPSAPISSALMTTTMMRMKDVVELVKEKQLKTKVIIGGAVITQSYADEIGADGYSKDAADAVRLVQRLLGLSLR